MLRGDNGRPLAIEGLWALRFGNGAGAGPVDTLYFTAGIEDEAHGLFGTLTPSPSSPVMIPTTTMMMPTTTTTAIEPA